MGSARLNDQQRQRGACEVLVVPCAEEGVVADPDDTAAIKTVGAAYEAWVNDIGYDPERTDMAGGELEEEE